MDETAAGRRHWRDNSETRPMGRQNRPRHGLWRRSRDSTSRRLDRRSPGANCDDASKGIETRPGPLARKPTSRVSLCDTTRQSAPSTKRTSPRPPGSPRPIRRLRRADHGGPGDAHLFFSLCLSSGPGRGQRGQHPIMAAQDGRGSHVQLRVGRRCIGVDRKSVV